MLSDLKPLPSEKELAEIALANYDKFVELYKIDSYFTTGDHYVTILCSPGNSETMFILYDGEHAFQYYLDREQKRVVKISNRFYAQRVLM